MMQDYKKNARFIISCVCWLIAAFPLMAQTVSGVLKDKADHPLGYANIVLLTLDSMIVEGTVSNENGFFRMPVAVGTHYLLKITSVGYQTVFKNCTNGDLGVIRISEQALVLDEMVVTARRPTYQLKNGKLIANVQNSLLSKIGTASDVLSHIPGVQGKDGAYTVFGKGTPVIYLNGRLVRDLSELERLNSENIAKVEILNNPGAQYDASVKAVIRIQTTRPLGEGFGLDMRSSVEKSRKAGVLEQFNLNYRQGGLDLFGGFTYTLRNFYQESSLVQTTRLDTLWRQNYTFDTDFKRHIYDGNIGLNYQFNDKHSVGARYTIHAMPMNTKKSYVGSQVYADDKTYDYWEDIGHTNERRGPEQQLNTYYNGIIGKLNIDFNADLLWNSNRLSDHVEESSLNFEDRIINTLSRNSSHVYAAKIILSYPLWGGNLSVGNEFTSMKKNDYYKNEQHILPSTDNEASENTEAAFIDYAHTFGKLDISAGVRYEHINYHFQEFGNPLGEDDLKRIYDNLFPSVSLSYPMGKVQTQLSYSEKIHRPDYSDLSNNLSYINRFTYKGGNPKLQPETIHDVRLDLSYKWIQLSVDYQHFKDVIINVSEQYKQDPKIAFVTFRNFDKLDCLNTSLSISPKVGVWEPLLYVGMRKQWFNIPSENSLKAMNKPTFMFTFNNAIKLPRGFIVRADFYYQTEGDMQNCFIGQTGEIDLSIRKSFFHDCLNLNLQWFDVGHLSRQYIDFYSGVNTGYQRTKLDSEIVRLTVKYKFNMGRSKYKGSGAGQDVMNRL